MKKFIIILAATTAATALAAVITTSALIANNRPQAPSPTSSLSQGDGQSGSQTESGNQSPSKTNINLTRLYDENSITISEHTEMHHGISCTFNQVSGLKDTAIQKKLNKTIADTQIALLEEYSKSFTPSGSSSTVYIGFSNIISVEYSFQSTKYSDSRKVYYTYNLADGLPVSLEDIFVDGADYTPIVNDIFYKGLISHYINGSFGYSEDKYVYYDDNDKPRVSENELRKILKKYLNQQTRQFGFDGVNLYFSCEDVVVSAKMCDIADKLAIFDRFKTDESLFKDDSIGQKDLIPFASIYFGDDRFNKLEYGYILDNLWCDTVITDYFETDVPPDMVSDYNTFMDNVCRQKQAALEQYKKTAKDNPDKMYIVFQRSAYQYYFDEEQDGTLVENLDGTTVIEMSKEYFDRHYKAILYDAYRSDIIGLAVCNNGKLGAVIENPKDKNINYTQTCYHSFINFITGEVEEKTKLNLEKDSISLGGFR